MAFPPRFLDDIKDRVALVDVVSRRVKLVRKGREHLGLCPFHNEKTPSFTVNEEKGFYHCFGCGAHGDAISFVQNTQSLTFLEAVEQLAGLAGLPMPEQTPEDKIREEKRVGLAEAVDAASRWFADQLRGAPGEAARHYLSGRGLDEQAVGHFRLGFAPDSRDALKTALTGQGFAVEILVEAGLLRQPDDGGAPYDLFRNRVMFPITDRRGRVVAFGGRLLGDARAPKYINSPDTPLFHKGQMLYNLDHAAAAVREGAQLVVAEGYMDVIALYRAGFEGAVAPLGTALTEDQINALWRHADEPILCFDGDEAGARAAARAADRALPLLRPGKSLRYATLPPGKDPDDLITAGGAAAMRRVLDDGVPMSELIWKLELGARSIETPERRADLEGRLRQRTRQIVDPSVRQYYWSAFRDRLFHSFRTGGRRAGDARRASGWTEASGRALASAAAVPRRRQQVVLATLLQHPTLADEFSDLLAHAELDQDLDGLLQALQKHLAANPDLDAETLKRHLSRDGFAALVGALCADDVLAHAAFARPGTPVATARAGLSEVLAFIFQGRRMEELEATARYTADHPDAETEARFLAFRQDVELSERRMRETEDWISDAGTRDDGV
ncbi:MAG: DNA primase [Rhodospirillales bacterium]|nr:MAG: DNA primase [Rhodospirillales bacterium]